MPDLFQDLANSDPEWSVLNLRYFNPVGAHKSGLIGEDAGPSPKNIFPCLTKTAFGRMPEVRVFGRDYNTPDGTGRSYPAHALGTLDALFKRNHHHH